MRGLALSVALSASAVAAPGSCVLGPAPSTVKVFFQVSQGIGELWFEGAEEERTACLKVANDQVDLQLTCGVDEELSTLLIKGSLGQWLDAQGGEIATLRQCRLR